MSATSKYFNRDVSGASSFAKTYSSSPNKSTVCGLAQPGIYTLSTIKVYKGSSKCQSASPDASLHGCVSRMYGSKNSATSCSDSLFDHFLSDLLSPGPPKGPPGPPEGPHENPPGPRPKPGPARARFWKSANLEIQKFGIENISNMPFQAIFPWAGKKKQKKCKTNR